MNERQRISEPTSFFFTLITYHMFQKGYKIDHVDEAWLAELYLEFLRMYTIQEILSQQIDSKIVVAMRGTGDILIFNEVTGNCVLSASKDEEGTVSDEDRKSILAQLPCDPNKAKPLASIRFDSELKCETMLLNYEENK